MFYRGSRYEKVADLTIADDAGREIKYKAIRLIPETTGVRKHALTDGERLDHVAFRYYKDAERAWRILDANEAMWPPDLAAEPGRSLLIPSSEG
jgi:hypothetical protein